MECELEVCRRAIVTAFALTLIATAALAQQPVVHHPSVLPADVAALLAKAKNEGGMSQTVAKGDFIIVPENAPHWFSAINGVFVLMTLHVPRPVFFVPRGASFRLFVDRPYVFVPALRRVSAVIQVFVFFDLEGGIGRDGSNQPFVDTADCGVVRPLCPHYFVTMSR